MVGAGASEATTRPARVMTKVSPACSTASSTSENRRAASVAVTCLTKSDYLISSRVCHLALECKALRQTTDGQCDRTRRPVSSAQLAPVGLDVAEREQQQVPEAALGRLA